MEIKVTPQPVVAVKADMLAVVVLDHNVSKDKDAKPQIKTANADPALAEAVAGAIASGDLTGRAMETTVIFAPKGMAAERLLLIGGDKAAKFDADMLRKAAGTAARTAKARNLKNIAFLIPEAPDQNVTASAAALTEGAIIGDFDPNYYQTDKKDQHLAEFAVVVPASLNPAAARTGTEYGRIVGESQNFARDLVNEPGNRMTPTIMGERARDMASEVLFKSDASSTEKLKEL